MVTNLCVRVPYTARADKCQRLRGFIGSLFGLLICLDDAHLRFPDVGIDQWISNGEEADRCNCLANRFAEFRPLISKADLNGHRKDGGDGDVEDDGSQ